MFSSSSAADHLSPDGLCCHLLHQHLLVLQTLGREHGLTTTLRGLVLFCFLLIVHWYTYFCPVQPIAMRRKLLAFSQALPVHSLLYGMFCSVLRRQHANMFSDI